MPPTVIVLLALGAVFAFGYAQRQKRLPLIVDRVEFRIERPDGRLERGVLRVGVCTDEVMKISFRTTVSDRVDVAVIRGNGRVIRRLTSDQYFRRYREHRLRWDGRTDDGLVPRSGPYRVQMTMHGESREVRFPGRIHLRKDRDRSCLKRGTERGSVQGGPG